MIPRSTMGQLAGCMQQRTIRDTVLNKVEGEEWHTQICHLIMHAVAHTHTHALGYAHATQRFLK